MKIIIAVLTISVAMSIWIFGMGKQFGNSSSSDTTLIETPIKDEGTSVENTGVECLPINAILEIKKSGKGSKARDLLEANGYNKAANKDNVEYWVKNTKAVKEEVGHGGGYSAVEYTSRPTKNANGEVLGSMVSLSCDENDNISIFSIETYGAKGLLLWKKQFEELGYKIDVIEGNYDMCSDEEKAHQKEKDGWSIGTERNDGAWVNAMYFEKGDEQMTIIDCEDNRYMIYF